MITFILIIIPISLVFIECSNKFNTDNVIEKIGHALIFFGCLLALSGEDYDMILLGLSLDFLSRILRSYIDRRNRRATDHMKRKMQ